MQDTSIEWADMTWNPTRGCSRISQGCVHCYAEKITARFSDGPAFAGFAEFRIIGGKREAHWTGKVELVEDKLLEPLSRRKWALKFAEKHGRKPRCFVNSMSDLFHENLPDKSIDRVFAIMALCPEIDFLVLTKRASRMPLYMDLAREERGANDTRQYDMRGCAVNMRARQVLISANLIPADEYTDEDNVWIDNFPWLHASGPMMLWPLPNVRLGTSTEDQQRFNQRIVPLLQLSEMGWETMISAEPLLGPIDMPWLSRLKDTWVITGAESGQGARPCDEAWIHSLQRQCADNHVPFFYKQAATLSGRKIPTPEINGKRYVEFPAVGLRG